MPLHRLPAFLGLVACAGLSPYANADQVHYTTRLDWIDVVAGDDHPPLRAGHAVDVHTEGDPKASIQYSFVNGVKPNARYDVVYFIDGLDSNFCALVDVRGPLRCVSRDRRPRHRASERDVETR